MKNMTTKINKLKIAFIFIVMIVPSLNMIKVVSATALTSTHLSSTGVIRYSSTQAVNVDLNQETGTNLLALGYQLDGPDISPFTKNAYLRTDASDANLVFVRFFEHRLGKPCLTWNEATKTGTWDWSKIDGLVRQIYSTGAEPLIVLGFYSWTLNTMSSAPTGMSTNANTGLPNPDQWCAYCTAWVQHFKDVGLPVKNYEIMNEAYHYFGWPAKQPKLGYFMDLFHSAAQGMRNVNPNVQLGNDATTMKNVLSTFISNGEKLDFISFHRYGLANLNDPDSTAITNAETLYMVDSSTFYAPGQAVKVYSAATGNTLPLINTEGNISDEELDPRVHTMLGGVYTALSTRTYILAGVSYSVYFHLAGKSNTMGMIDTDTKTPYYPYYVLKMIGNSLSPGDKIVYSSSPSNDLRSLVWIHNGKTCILLILKADTSMTFSINGITGAYTYQKIDSSIDWQSASIQTGSYQGGNLSLNGYTVMLLQQA
jgi:Glycosyl hydrolases family 39